MLEISRLQTDIRDMQATECNSSEAVVTLRNEVGGGRLSGVTYSRLGPVMNMNVSFVWHCCLYCTIKVPNSSLFACYIYTQAKVTRTIRHMTLL